MASRNRRTRSKAPAAGRPRLREILGKTALAAAVLVLAAAPAVFVASPITYVPPIMVLTCLVLSLVYLAIVSRRLTFSEASMADSC